MQIVERRQQHPLRQIAGRAEQQQLGHGIAVGMTSRRPTGRLTGSATAASRQAGSSPAMRFRFCTAAPPAPLPRLSSVATSRACASCRIVAAHPQGQSVGPGILLDRRPLTRLADRACPRTSGLNRHTHRAGTASIISQRVAGRFATWRRAAAAPRRSCRGYSARDRGGEESAAWARPAWPAFPATCLCASAETRRRGKRGRGRCPSRTRAIIALPPPE